MGDVGSSGPPDPDGPGAAAAAGDAVESPAGYDLDRESGPMKIGPVPRPARKDKDKSGRGCETIADIDPDPEERAWVGSWKAAGAVPGR